MKKALFIDRDGTIIWEPPETYQVDTLEQLKFLPGVIRNLYEISKLGYEFVMVTNQDGLGTENYPQANFDLVQNKMLEILSNENISFDDILIDKSYPSENLPTRKPGTGLLTKYLTGYDLKNSFVIGDRETDVILANNLGAKSIFIKNFDSSDSFTSKPDLVVSTWDEIYNHLRYPPRIASKRRDTKETKIFIEICLDGSGKAKISTGLGFFDHMLEQIARHGELDLTIKVDGDLHVDEHHVIEDVGITLGEVFAEALGDKRGIERYSFVLPMDDTLANVALDLGGRPWLIWNAEFKREMIGDVPTEMFSHFFKSFSDAAKCNLNINSEAGNEHHKIEGIFKAFAKCLKMAVKRGSSDILPTTKGVI